MGLTAARRILSTLAIALLTCFAGALLPGAVTAQTAEWPTRPVRLIVGYPPGGGADTVARLLADRLSKSLGQTVLVDNRAGASGAIAATAVARAEPDGYMLLVAASSEISVAPATVKALAYEPLRDFKPIAQLAKWPFIIVTSASSPTGSLAELIAYAKANPGKLSYSSFGNNSMNHLIGEDFKLKAGINAVHIPYKGSGPSLTGLLGGEVQYTFDAPATMLALISAGRLRPLAVTSAQRLPNASQIPTTAEAGLPGLIASGWIGLLAPVKTPAAITARLGEAVAAILQSPEFRTELQNRSILPGSGSAEEFAQAIQSEIASWRQIGPRVGITPE
jgi:tripartite-type tricarboxylate transporter receptor subunit TctC